MTGNTSEAEDLTQEVFLQLYKKLDTFRGESAFYTWLHRPAVNVVLMRLRRLKARQEAFLEDLPRPDQDDGTTFPVEIRTPDLRLQGTLDRLTLEWAIDELPPGFRTVFLLHDVEGYGHDEICGLTGWSRGTSKSQLHRARLRLRMLLCQGVRRGTVEAKLPASTLPALRRAAEAEPVLAT